MPWVQWPHGLLASEGTLGAAEADSQGGGWAQPTLPSAWLCLAVSVSLLGPPGWGQEAQC